MGLIRKSYRLAVLVVTLMLWSSQAYSIVIFQHSAFIHSSNFGPDSLEETVIGTGLNEFSGAGLNFTFTQSLDANDFGRLSWQVTNNTGSDLFDVSFFGFLDAEIDEIFNSFFNESGALISVLGMGAADSAADFWEIDEPGFVFGDIFDNLQDGSLDNANGVPAGSEDDVSLALGFDIGTFLSGQRLLVSLDLSLSDIGGLRHSDPDSNSRFYFNGNAALQDIVDVPEPGILLLLIIGLAGLSITRKLSS